MATRETYGSASLGAISGDTYMDNVAAHFARLYDAACFPLSAVAGVDDITATLDPALLAGLVDGMKVTLSWPADNTGAMTLALNGAAAVPIVDASGAAISAGSVSAGQRALLEYVGGSWRILNAASASGGGVVPRYRQQFDASGTWTKPDGLDADTVVMVELWGGGGGGGSATYGGGGGGGAYQRAFFRLGDLPAAVSVTVAAGGAIQSAGGSSSFGALAYAYGGGAGNTGNGGGGGGIGGRGGNAGSSTTLDQGGLGGGFAGAASGYTVPGAGGASASNGAPANLSGAGGSGGSGASSLTGGDAYDGGGGGGLGVSSNFTLHCTGHSVYGGGGGGGRTGSGNMNGGQSTYGGDGGNGGAAGFVPGGGGGRGAAGAAGRVVVWC